jgi:quercetin dioxygenase-like cupin family protein
MRRNIAIFLLGTIMTFAGFSLTAKAQQDELQKKKDILNESIPGLKIENLMTSPLGSVEGMEVIITQLEVPAQTTLPKHWHPGEEFVYVQKGEVVIWQKDEPETSLKEGDVFKIPLKQIHTAKTGKQGATALVFRVHKTGEPIRVNIE